jgi:hypothetical protein
MSREVIATSKNILWQISTGTVLQWECNGVETQEATDKFSLSFEAYLVGGDPESRKLIAGAKVCPRRSVGTANF